MRIWIAFAIVGLLPQGLVAREPLAAYQIASEVARMGPRSSHRDPAHQTAQHALLDYMQEVGLKGVGLLPAGMPDIFNLSGYLPGSSGWQVILSAHYDTVPNSPGAIDDASGCGVVLAAASELARTPRRHQIRVILFDQEEVGGRGSRIWLDQTRLSGRESVLANINVDMVGWS